MNPEPWYRFAFLNGPRGRLIAAAAAVTLITVAIIGAVVVTVTPAGCQVGNKLGLKGKGCVAGQPVAVRTTPAPPSSFPTSPATFPASQPYTPPASQPYYPPASQPYYPPASQPYAPPGSAPYPSTPITSGTSPYRSQLSCSLPVYVGGSGSGGFVTFPSGNFIADPKSAVALPSPGQQGVGPGNLSYDHAYSRWLPVEFSQVSPDGAHYAFAASNAIYQVNVATGVPTEVGSGHAWRIVGVKNEGVYAEEVNLAGLNLFAYSGTTTRITASGFWQTVDGTSAYGTATSAVPQGVSNTIIKLNLQTVSTSDFFTQPGFQMNVVGSDGHGGEVMYGYGNQGSTVWIVTGPTTATLIASSYAGFNPSGPPIADRNGVWFFGYLPYGGGNVIALYVAGSGFYNVSSIGANLAGTCS